MKKFLLGLPIVIIGVILFFTPYILFGDIGMNVFYMIIAIFALGFASWAIGDTIKYHKK